LSTENLLQEIKVSDLVTIGSLIIAFLALFIAPFVNARNSKRQVIAPMRQAWINTLRDKISEFMAIISINRIAYSPSTDWKDERKERAEKLDLENYKNLQHLLASIKLHINPEEPLHVQLIQLLEDATKDYHDSFVSDEKHEKIIELSQVILKKEWVVTKKA